MFDQLAGLVVETKVVRYVRTSEGARKYGVPIGSRIMPNGQIVGPNGRLIKPKKTSATSKPKVTFIAPKKSASKKVPTKKPTSKPIIGPIKKKPVAPKKVTPKKRTNSIKPKKPAKPLSRVQRAERALKSREQQLKKLLKSDVSNKLPKIKWTGGSGYGTKLPTIGKPRKRTIYEMTRDLNWKPKVMNTPRPKVVSPIVKASTRGKTWGQLAKIAGMSIGKLMALNGIKDPGTRSKKVLAGMLPRELKITTKASRKAERDSKKAGKDWDREVLREKKVIDRKVREYAKNTWSGIKTGRTSSGRKLKYYTFDSDRLGEHSKQKAVIYQRPDGRWQYQVGKVHGVSNTPAGAMRKLKPYLPVSGHQKLADDARGFERPRPKSSATDPTKAAKVKRLRELVKRQRKAATKARAVARKAEAARRKKLSAAKALAKRKASELAKKKREAERKKKVQQREAERRQREREREQERRDREALTEQRRRYSRIGSPTVIGGVGARYSDR